MAVVQISRIQLRRGLHDNLPNLASAEMGWSLDQRRLFIGNGTASEGAPVTGRTEILTEHSDILQLINIFSFKAERTGSIAATGPNNTQFTRSLQEKLDDFVNVRDFGAKGDGITDDTNAINRALNNTYSYTSAISGVPTRRTIYFPAGKYLVSDLINVPPFVTVVGDGYENTLIYTNTNIASILNLTDSHGASGPTFGSPLGLIPTYGKDYAISNIAIQHSNVNVLPCVSINSASEVSFDRVKFAGPNASVIDPGTSHAAVYVSNDALTAGFVAKRLKFNDCKFANHGYGIETLGEVTDVVVNGSSFEGLYTDVVLSNETTNVVQTNNVASNISSAAFDSTYIDSHNGAGSSTARSVTLTQGTTGNIQLVSDVLISLDNVEIEYTIKVGAATRKGKFVGVGTGSAYVWDDEYAETSALNVDLEADETSGNFAYDTTGAASDATITYVVKYIN